MSTTQGEKPETRLSKIVAGIVAGVVTFGIVAGSVAFVTNAQAHAAAHTQLMAELKSDGKVLNAAASEDVDLNNSAVAATQANHVQAVAAAEIAERLAAEQAAIVEANRIAAEAAAQVAAQRAAKKQVVRQQATAADGTPASTGGAGSGTPVPFIASSDPNNAAGGDYADPGSFCASHSASTVNGVPTCD